MATLIVAIAGYAIIFLSARVLGPADNGIFMVFWSALYLGIGTIFGLQQESTRAVRNLRYVDGAAHRPRLGWAALAAGGIVALLVAVTSPLWAPSAFQDNAVLFTALVVLGILLYSGHAMLAGSLAGATLWRPFSALLVAEALLRAGLFGIVLGVSQSIGWLAIVSTLATGTWLVLLLHPMYRRAIAVRSDASLGVSITRMLQGAVAAASSAAIITGFPLLLSMTSADSAATFGVVVLVVTITRAPILVPLNAFLGVLVARFVDDRTWSLVPVVRPMVALVGATLVVAAVGLIVGEQAFVLVFGEEYRIDALFIAGCILAAGIIGAMNIAGAAVLARGLHVLYSTGWLAAVVVAVVILLVPLALKERVVLALIGGPTVGILLHLGSLALRRPTRSS